MKLLNRSAFVVLPKQPFADWTHSLEVDAGGLNQLLTLEEQRREGTVYLIDEVSDEADFATALKAHWKAIFTSELSAWDEIGDDWPHNLTIDLFLAWFEVSHQIMVFDLSQKPLLMAALEEY
ncbi:MAG: hypothetical protein CSA60_00875 [Neptuniibacter caesariensis]|uniref:VacJ n=1 Tax=Neptuniibacter caesariensis TaxID=207954 RepID=A0A2G6JQ07_NEPCE|nr:MAG: hypothetical protein CSA60_00875 [Neptuniibacter caesariensis]